MVNFKISLKAARVNCNMTQEEFAVKLGVSASTVLNWETGKTEPNVSQLRAISDLSGVPIDAISVPCKS